MSPQSLQPFPITVPTLLHFPRQKFWYQAITNFFEIPPNILPNSGDSFGILILSQNIQLPWFALNPNSNHCTWPPWIKIRNISERVLEYFVLCAFPPSKRHNFFYRNNFKFFAFQFDYWKLSKMMQKPRQIAVTTLIYQIHKVTSPFNFLQYRYESQVRFGFLSNSDPFKENLFVSSQNNSRSTSLLSTGTFTRSPLRKLTKTARPIIIRCSEISIYKKRMSLLAIAIFKQQKIAHLTIPQKQANPGRILYPSWAKDPTNLRSQANSKLSFWIFSAHIQDKSRLYPKLTYCKKIALSFIRCSHIW